LCGASDPIGVLAVEEGAVLSGVGDVVAHAGEPLERVHGLEVPPQGGVHAGAVEDGVAAVEGDELPEREGVSDEVGGGIFEAPRVGRSDGVADVGREAGMSPGEQLRDELGRDGVGEDEPGQQALAE
jgi:hypothetical protein